MGGRSSRQLHLRRILVGTVTSILIVSFASSTVAAGTVPLYQDDTSDGGFLGGVTGAVESTTNNTTDAVEGTVATTTTDTVDGVVHESTDTLSSPPPSLQLIETIVDTGTDDGTAGEPAARRGDTMDPTGVTTRPAVRPSSIAADDASAPPIAAMNGGSPSRDGPVDPGPLGAGATATASVGVVAIGARPGIGNGIESHVQTLVGDRLDRLVRLLAPFRYSRYDGSDPLDHEDRAAINDHVTVQPGAYLSAISEALDMHISTVRHHVKILEREGVVETAKVRGRRRLFPAHTQQQALVAALDVDATARILTTLARRGPCSGGELADAVDRSVSTISHHLSRLAADELVVRETHGRTTVNRLPADVQAALAPEQEAPRVGTSAVTAD